MQTQDLSSEPLLLLVDDNTKSLQNRRELFDEVGFATLAVEDEQQAIKEFVASPGVDVVITDIRLHTKKPLDKSGVSLARRLKEINPEIPIVGYSAAFAEDELTEEERSLFASFYARGGSTPREIMKHIDQWKTLATSFRQERLTAAQEKLEHYRTKYGQTTPEYSIMRFLVPNRLVQSSGDMSSVEDVLRNAGFELRFINRGAPRPTIKDDIAHLQSPLLIWLHKDAEITISEVYGYPEFYSYGDSEEEAIGNLLLLMDGFYRDYKIQSADSARNKQIGGFLDSIFE
jgi:CheY-like chemotaxis protein